MRCFILLPALTVAALPAPVRQPVASAGRKKLSPSAKYLLTRRCCGRLLSIMAKYDTDLSLLFHALSDPTRRAMLTRLAAGPAQVTELAQPTGLRLPTVMRHLAVLEAAGLIASAKDGRVRTCAIEPQALVPVRAWLDEQRALWEARLDRLDDYVMTLMKERKDDDRA